jgi:DNA transformation protein and related proteins
MASSSEFHDFVLDQLAGLGELRSRKMFGEYGIYCDDLFFALIADESFWLKVDDVNRPRFEARGMKPFSPWESPKPMQYYEVPLDVLEDPGQLREWAGEAVEVAARAPKRKKRKK